MSRNRRTGQRRRWQVIALLGLMVMLLGAGAVWGGALWRGGPEGQLTVSDGQDGGALQNDPRTVFKVPLVRKPTYLVPIHPAPFGTEVIRIAADPGSPLVLERGSGVWGSDARHHYSKNQPWNADGTLLALQNRGGGSPTFVLLDGNTYEPRYGRCPGYQGDDRWHPSTAYPHIRIAANDTLLQWYDVVACRRVRRWRLPFPVVRLGMSEGNPSFDGRFVALSDGVSAFVVDMDPQPPFEPYPHRRIGPAVAITDCGLPRECEVGWVSISPSGRYAVVAYRGAFLRVYDVDPETLALTPRPMAPTSPRCRGTAAKGFIYDLGHADMTLNPFDNGEDVIIGQEHCRNRGEKVGGVLIGGVMMVRLRDGAITALTNPRNESYPHHVSTRSYDRPGWAYVGYYAAPGKRFDDEIVAVKLDGSGSVERLAHKHGVSKDCYRCEAHAVPSRDGQRVLWASNWSGNSGGSGVDSVVQAYVVDTRAQR